MLKTQVQFIYIYIYVPLTLKVLLFKKTKQHTQNLRKKQNPNLAPQQKKTTKTDKITPKGGENTYVHTNMNS